MYKNKNNKDCRPCKTFLKSKSINNKKDFLLWARKNHPDKGGSQNTFKKVSHCNDILFGINEDCSNMPKSSTILMALVLLSKQVANFRQSY